MTDNKCRVLIRNMLETDIEAVYEIETQSITPPWSRQGFADALANDNAVFYVAEICDEMHSASNWNGDCISPSSEQEADGNRPVLKNEQKKKVVGYCGLYIAADEGEITNVAVSPAWRGMGIADQILAVVRGDAKVRQVARIYLEVRESNLPARNLYEKHGFEAAGLRKNFYREPTENAIVMMCSLEQI